MEGFEEKSRLENDEQHQELGFQSDPPISNDNLVEALTQELENLVISCEDEVPVRDLPRRSVVVDGEDGLKRAIGEELQQLVVKEAVNEAFQAESPSEVGENVRRFVHEAIERHGLKKVAEDPKECRVLEERGVGENGLGHEQDSKQIGGDDDEDDDVKVLEHKGDDLREKNEIKIEDELVGSEIEGYEYNGEERRSEDEHDREFENGEELEDGGEVGEGGAVAAPRRYHYPVRPDALDCSFYMRTGMCKFGSNCKFNHPLKRRNQQPPKEIMKQKEENSERPGQIDCKYYLSSAGCKYGKACKFNHGRGKTVVTPVVEYNFLGLPIRPGEKECPYYMRNGSCKYGPNCRFNHPDPTAVGGGDVSITYGNGAPQPTMPSWSAPRTPDRPAAFVPMMYSPPQTMPPPNPDWNGPPPNPDWNGPPPNPDWNGYPAPAPPPVYPTSERGLPIPPAFFLNNPPTDTNPYTHPQPHMLVSEYPERPGQPECSFFMKTGDCKYRSSCKFHHPKSRNTRTGPSVLSDKGLPLRPDQNICTHYSRYGICKYGPGCKYDHPVNYSPTTTTTGGDGSKRGGLIQQSV